MIFVKDIILVVLGFILLIKGADYFVDAAVCIATRLGIPHVIVGLTIVALGTSAPEAAVSIQSALVGSNGIAIGNVLGSNIMNVFVILGVTACITHLHFKKTIINYDLPFLLIISVLFPLLGLCLHQLSRLVGTLFLAILVYYLVHLVRQARNTNEEQETDTVKNYSAFFIILFLFGGIAAIVAGSNIAVSGAKSIAAAIGVSDRIIGLTIVAFGTSLPELMTSVTAAKKGNADIAIGNIVGSNIFNILFILGMTAVIQPIPFGVEYIVDCGVAVLAVILLWIISKKNQMMLRKDGIFFLVVYAAYFVYMALL